MLSSSMKSVKSVKSTSKVCVRPASSRASSMVATRASAVPRSTSSAKSSSKSGVRGDVRVFGGDEYGASSTSFYTTTEKQDSYDSLEVVLGTKCADTQMRTLIVEMLADIAEALRSALVTVEGSSNTFGDAQLSVDVIADEIMWNKCRESSTVAFGASEEEPEVKPCNPNGEYTV